MEKISHGWYVGRPPPLLIHDSERVAAARCAQEPAPVPTTEGPMGPCKLVGRGGGSALPGLCQVPADGNLFPKPHHIQRLRLLPKKTLARYAGTSHFLSWEAQCSASADIWGYPASISTLGRAHTLNLRRQWWTKLRRRWQRLGPPR